jgi:hypothetical protein
LGRFQVRAEEQVPDDDREGKDQHLQQADDEQRDHLPDDQGGGVQGGQDHLGDPVLLLFQSAAQHLVAQQDDADVEDQQEQHRWNHGVQAAEHLPVPIGLRRDGDLAVIKALN